MTEERVNRVVKVVEEMKKASWTLFEYYRDNANELMAKREFAEWDSCNHFLRMLEDEEYLSDMENIYFTEEN